MNSHELKLSVHDRQHQASMERARDTRATAHACAKGIMASEPKCPIHLAMHCRAISVSRSFKFVVRNTCLTYINLP